MTQFPELRLGELNAREDLSLRLGDAMDVKASISLAVILFLSAQTAYFFDKGLPRYGVYIQIVSIVCVVLAALLALLELWPTTYGLPAPESPRISERLAELTKHYSPYPDVEKRVVEAIVQDETVWAIERIKDNDKNIDRKAVMLAGSFWFTCVALLLNLATVFPYLFKLIA